MIESTFCHIPGVGVKTEARLWALGCHTWEAALAQVGAGVTGGLAAKLGRELPESRARLTAGDAVYFADRLPASEQWRLAPAFWDRALCLDIETTGTGGYGDHVTTVATYDGERVRTYIYGRNLEDLQDDLGEPRPAGDLQRQVL